jgi:hypothetical protein
MATTQPIIHNSASILDKVEGEVKKIGADIQGGFVKIFGQAAVSQFETTIKDLAQDDVVTIFSDAVNLAESLQINGTPATSEQKRTAAFEQIVKDLATAGKSLATNVVNLGIELVVGLLKSKTPAPAATS